MSEEKTVKEVYEDRNAAVMALAEMVHQHRVQLTDLPRNFQRGDPRDYRACWKPDQGDDADADEWAIVYAWLPTGQVSWHVPRELAEESNLPQKHAEWDGHDRDEKNRRARRFANGSHTLAD